MLDAGVNNESQVYKFYKLQVRVKVFPIWKSKIVNTCLNVIQCVAVITRSIIYAIHIKDTA